MGPLSLLVSADLLKNEEGPAASEQLLEQLLGR